MTKPNMVMRSIRVPITLWEAAKVRADERQENISDVLRAALERYVGEGLVDPHTCVRCGRQGSGVDTMTYLGRTYCTHVVSCEARVFANVQGAR